MVVVDASAVVAALVPTPVRAALEQRLAEQAELGAPELLSLEVHQAIRGLVRSGIAPESQGARLRDDFLALALDTFPHGPLLPRVWELRGQLTAYDACYVALAEALNIPLVTTDRRLARSKGHRAEIELY